MRYTLKPKEDQGETKRHEDAVEASIEAGFQNEIAEMKAHIAYLEDERIKLHGVIEGLKFAIRCNGISGGEVK